MVQTRLKLARITDNMDRFAMPEHPQTTGAPQDEPPMSAESLSAAFARLLGGETISQGDAGALGNAGSAGDAGPAPPGLGGPMANSAEPDHRCQIGPSSLLEAMLFVGDPDNKPLSSTRLAGLLRGVDAAEIHSLVRELNDRYAACRLPYHIVGEGEGFRMALRDEFQRVRQRFFSRVRQARLSQAAIDVLSLVAYREPLAADEISELRGKPSTAILAQLVRRQLLRIDRDEQNPRRLRYRTTRRFLDLFGLATLDDLPRNQELSGS